MAVTFDPSSSQHGFDEGLLGQKKEPSATTLATVKMRMDLVKTFIFTNLRTVVGGLKMARGPAVAISGVSATMGGILIAPAILGIGIEVNATIQDVRRQQSGLGKAGATFRAFVPDRPLLLNLSLIGWGAVCMAKNIGAALRSLPPSVLSSLGVACTCLGAAAGSFITIIGLSEIGKGTYDVLKKHNKKIKELNAKIVELNSQNANDPLSKLQLSSLKHELSKEKIARTKSLLKIARGVCVTITGVLAVAAVFTQGASFVGVAVAAVVVSIIDIGVAIYSHAKGKQDQQALKAQSVDLKKAYQHLIEQAKDENARPELAARLALDSTATLESVTAKLQENFKEIIAE